MFINNFHIQHQSNFLDTSVSYITNLDFHIAYDGLSCGI